MVGKILFWLGLAAIVWYLIREMLISLDIYIRKAGIARKEVRKQTRKPFKFSTDPIYHR